jgi:translation initiation factor IF-3
MNQPPVNDGPRMNESIRVPNIRLIDETGENHGVVDTRASLERAFAINLDLVEISPNAAPPVCKIMDYGRFKYQEQKKKNEARKKQKIVETKEIKMRPGIDEHDYEVKMRNVGRFLGDGDKVKFTIRFRGREMAHQDRGMMVLNRVKGDLGETVKVETTPKMEGRQMIMIVSPK